MLRILTLYLILDLLGGTKAVSKNQCGKILQKILSQQYVTELYHDAFPNEVINSLVALRGKSSESSVLTRAQIEKLLEASPAKDYFSKN